MNRKRKSLYFLLAILLLATGLFLYRAGTKPEPGKVLDEASRVGRQSVSFPAADEDYFRAMDGGVTLTGEEVKGRDMWIVWTGGNDRFWDAISAKSLCALQFLTTPC